MKTHPISEMLAKQDFFRDMSKDHLDFFAGCASNVRFSEGEFMVLRGKPTTHFYLIRKGRAALEVNAGNLNSSRYSVGSARTNTTSPDSA